MRTNLIYFAVAGMSLFLHGQQSSQDAARFDPVHSFEVSELQADFQILRAALEEGHAGLFRYQTENQFQSTWDSAFKSIVRPMAEIEFLRSLSTLIAGIHYGHTSIRMSRDGMNYYNDQPVFLPMNVRIFDGNVFISEYFGDGEVQRGSRIIHINGLGVEHILKTILLTVPHDAHIETIRYRRLENPRTFAMAYAVQFGPSRKFSVVIETPEQENRRSLEMSGVSYKALEEERVARYPEAILPKPPIEKRIEKDLAILTIRTFGSGAYRRASIDYRDFLKIYFSELDSMDIDNTILDLRDNSGGDDEYGKLLFSYFADSQFDYYKALEMKKPTFEFLKYTDIPPADRTAPSESLRRNERGWVDVLAHPNVGVQQPSSPHYDGNLYVLINGGSFSATGETTSLMHFHKKATFIGEECGAGYYGNNSGYTAMMTLPNTRLRIFIPLVRYTMAVEGYPEDRGIIPDHLISPTVQDWLEGKDVVIEAARRIAGREVR